MPFVFILALTAGFLSCAKRAELSEPASVAAPCPNLTRAFADVVVQARGDAGNRSALAANGVRGAGDFAGGTDVFSLDQTDDGELVLRWSQGAVCNEAGPDLVVFENAFRTAGATASTSVYFEPVVVSVSPDGVRYEDFPHYYRGRERGGKRDLVREPGSLLPQDWVGFAGMQPVRYHENRAAQCHDPFVAETSGGDFFDLDNLGPGRLADQIRAEGFSYVKLTAAPAKLNPATCDATGRNCRPFPRIRSGYADIDGVYAKCFR